MSLMRLLITTNLLTPVGQLMQNVHISSNNFVIIIHSLMQRSTQAKVSARLSSAFLDRLAVSGDFPSDSLLRSSIWAVLRLTQSWLLKKSSSDSLSQHALLAL